MTSTYQLDVDEALAADLADLEGNARLVRTAPVVVVASKPHNCARCSRRIESGEPYATRVWYSKRTRVRRKFCLSCNPWSDCRPLSDARALKAAGRLLARCSSLGELSPPVLAFVGSLLARASGCPF